MAVEEQGEGRKERMIEEIKGRNDGNELGKVRRKKKGKRGKEKEQERRGRRRETKE